MWRAFKIAWRIAWGTVELVIVVYVLDAIKDRQTGLIVGVLGLIYVTIRVMFLNQANVFMGLANGLEQRFYELERLWDPQKQQPAPDPAMGRFYVDLSIALVFLALVYLVCLLQVFSKL
jgi:hypothetical protein